VDLNGDGHVDVLSGSYSRQDRNMAGLFQVLLGTAEGTFKKPTAVLGTDQKPLILPGEGEDTMTDRICTRPFACDLDGDGHLDLVVGNFSGTFGWFRGAGKGTFEPQATWLVAGGAPMQVGMHSDPFLIDWDGDGDLDLLSGSAEGGVFLFENVGSKTAPKFAACVTLVGGEGHHMVEGADKIVFGDAHVTKPASSTRVWAADGKLDLLVGDMLTVSHLAQGVDEATARKEIAAIEQRMEKLFEEQQEEMDEKAMNSWQEKYQALNKEREKFVRDEMTGFVWLYRRK
jgi:L-fucose mutarotase/ribose pyranase (RbsD/FucU family)